MTLELAEIDSRHAARPGTDALKTYGLPEQPSHRLRTLINASPDPPQSVQLVDRFHAQNASALNAIAASPNLLSSLMAVFGHSAFLSDAVIKHPEWLIEAANAEDLSRVMRADEYASRLRQAIHASSAGLPSAYLIACFRRRELLRILLRDVMRLGSLSDVTEELSDLADAIIDVALAAIRRDLSQRYEIVEPGEFSVIALGKLGGRELNYSSDVDLMFLYRGGSRADARITDREFFKKIGNHLTELLSTYTSDGLCYRVDLRLRPDGRYGEVCHSVEGALQYYKSRARDWELQMLIKARVAAGDPDPGRELLDAVEPLIYSTTLDFKAVEAVSEARQRIHEKLKRSRQSGLDIKLASGGIRDIEFLVQCLQRLHGGRDSWVRHGGTMLALFRLRDKDHLSDREYSRLASAYQFLRNLEHRLQYYEDRQTHTLPTGIEQLGILARRMPDSSFNEVGAGSLERQLDEHLGAVRELYERVIHSQRAEYFDRIETPPAPSQRAEPAPAPPPAATPERAEFPQANLARFLEQRAPRFMQLLREAQIGRGRERFESFLEKTSGNASLLDLLDEPDVARATIDLFEHSPFFSDQLIRYPELLEEIRSACSERQGRTGFRPPLELTELRRFYRQQMARIQSDSVYHGVRVYKTLKRTSDLADSIIAAAYQIALRDAAETSPPLDPLYEPKDRMMVIALGRLGMREFDLASDADLVFALPDADAKEIAFWTAVAERIIHVISAYTGDGVIFTVDARLRPNGREGHLVQTESSFQNYFAYHAQAWEGIAYMKARCVAGNNDEADRFLHKLQELDWRRYGQNGRSRHQLAEMRAKIEKETGTRNPLKGGPGGYYDIDFALLYLRLKGAGMFFKVLNTPERIDVVEKMGHLDADDAAFLLDAATFYRAIDHAMRVSTGHAEGVLPTSPSQRAILCELVERWAPASLHGLCGDQSIQSTLALVRTRTRAFFERVFH